MTLYRWVQRSTSELVDAARPCRHAVGGRWFVDETYVKVAGKWRYVYRAIDDHGQVIDVFVSNRRDTKAATRFSGTAFRDHGEPDVATTVIRGHALIQNLRRGHYELGAHARPGLTVAAALDELAGAL